MRFEKGVILAVSGAGQNKYLTEEYISELRFLAKT
jgi:hypothetical protein